jgi:hypothetical protein
MCCPSSLPHGVGTSGACASTPLNRGVTESQDGLEGGSGASWQLSRIQSTVLASRPKSTPILKQGQVVSADATLRQPTRGGK